MAIKNICPRCKKAFSAPEEDLGKKPRQHPFPAGVELAVEQSVAFQL
jgi:hypothetical protein